MKKNVIKKQVMLVCLIGLVGIGTTSAYFTAFDKEDNRVAVGRNVTELEEDFPGPTPTPVGEDLEFKKTVYVINDSDERISNVDCYVRVMVSYSNYDIGQAVSLVGLDTENWFYNASDGYYYYKRSLPAGRATTPLFTGFRVEQDKIDKQYLEQIDDFHINIYEESVQKGDFQDYQTAWNFYLYPVETQSGREG